MTITVNVAPRKTNKLNYKFPIIGSLADLGILAASSAAARTTANAVRAKMAAAAATTAAVAAEVSTVAAAETVAVVGTEAVGAGAVAAGFAMPAVVVSSAPVVAGIAAGVLTAVVLKWGYDKVCGTVDVVALEDLEVVTPTAAPAAAEAPAAPAAAA